MGVHGDDYKTNILYTMKKRIIACGRILPETYRIPKSYKLILFYI